MGIFYSGISLIIEHDEDILSCKFYQCSDVKSQSSGLRT